MKLLEDKHQIDALYFGDAGEVLETMQNRYGENEVEKLQRGQSSSIALSITYYPGINEFQGRKTMQIIIMDYACI